jgi:hypothetical protein
MSRFHILGWITVACALGVTALLLQPPDRIAPQATQRPLGREIPESLPSPDPEPRQTRLRPEAPPAADLQVTAPDGSSPELASTARWIDATARKQLEEMTVRYRLTPSQQADIYPVIARNLPGFSPAMLIIGGSQAMRSPQVPATASPLPHATMQDELFDLLDPEQQVLMADDSVDTALWWQEIAALLEADLNAAISGSQPTGDPMQETPADQAAPDLNLFDLLDQ